MLLGPASTSPLTAIEPPKTEKSAFSASTPPRKHRLHLTSVPSSASAPLPTGTSDRPMIPAKLVLTLRVGIRTRTFVGLTPPLLKAMHEVPPWAAYPTGRLAVQEAHSLPDTEVRCGVGLHGRDGIGGARRDPGDAAGGGVQRVRPREGRGVGGVLRDAPGVAREAEVDDERDEQHEHGEADGDEDGDGAALVVGCGGRPLRTGAHHSSSVPVVDGVGVGVGDGDGAGVGLFAACRAWGPWSSSASACPRRRRRPWSSRAWPTCPLHGPCRGAHGGAVGGHLARAACGLGEVAHGRGVEGG